MMKRILTFLLSFTLFYSANAQEVEVVTLTDQFAGSGGVTLGPDGMIYIGNYGDALPNANGTQVWRMDLEGNLEVFASGLSGASGNDFDSEGNLFQSNIAGARISKISPNGMVSTFVTSGISGPVGIVIDEEDNLFVCNCSNNTIQKVTPEGESSLFLSHIILSCPNGITRDHLGNLYVANFNNGNIIKITPEGTPSIFANIPGNNNGHLTYAAKDSVLYVNSHGSSKVYRLNLEGEQEVVAGSGVRGNADGLWDEATFSRPNGIAASVSGDTLYLNSSIPTSNNGLPLNPSVIRRITGVKTTASNEVWPFEGTELNVFPNPAKNLVQLNYELPFAMNIALYCYDIHGELIQRIDKGWQTEGTHQHEFRVQNLPAGLYQFVLSNGQFNMARRISLQP
jgi:sugar lactone lactonase YvrE